MAKRREQVRLDTTADVVFNIGNQLASVANNVTLLTYKPHAKQRVFHKSTHMIRLYIGGNRSGKTVGGVIEGIYWLKKDHPYRRLPINPYEPVRGRAVAVDFDHGVDMILMPQYAQSIPKSLLINGSWEDSYSNRTLTLRDDSFLEFMSYDQDLDKFAGTSRHFVHMDEEPPNPIYKENLARVIDASGSLWITMTPIEGMTWVYDTLYEPGILGENKYVKVIVVDLTENPYLTDEQKDSFIQNLDEEDREARIHGRFIQMGGLIYKVFDPEPGGKHVLERENLKPPRNWEVLLGLDHGFNNPTAVGWHMISPDGDIITYREHYKAGLVIKEHAQIIKQEILRQGREPDQLIADPSIFNKDPITGTSIAQEYSKEGLFFTKGNNEVKAGIVRVNGYLKPRKTANGSLRARWHVTKDCKWHIKEMTRYRWKTYTNRKDQYEKNAFEEPHKKDDHAMDQLRYVIMSRPDLFSELSETAQQKIAHDSEYGMLSPGTVSHNARAGDFYSTEGMHTDGMEYAGPDENMPRGDIEYDEHLGGLW